jgi:hypothetical protein
MCKGVFSMVTTEKVSCENVVIVLADLQPEIIVNSKTNDEASLRKAASVLAETAGKLNIPIFNSLVPLGPGIVSKTISELGDGSTKLRSTFGVFDDEDSRKIIAAYNRPVIVIGGILSEVAVIEAARGALREGYTVQVLVDVCGGMSERTENAVFRQLESDGVTLSCVSSFLACMAPHLNDQRGSIVLSGLSRFWS